LETAGGAATGQRPVPTRSNRMPCAQRYVAASPYAAAAFSVAVSSFSRPLLLLTPPAARQASSELLYADHDDFPGTRKPSATDMMHRNHRSRIERAGLQPVRPGVCCLLLPSPSLPPRSLLHPPSPTALCVAALRSMSLRSLSLFRPNAGWFGSGALLAADFYALHPVDLLHAEGQPCVAFDWPVLVQPPNRPPLPQVASSTMCTS
jgi:hypothetical protein